MSLQLRLGIQGLGKWTESGEITSHSESGYFNHGRQATRLEPEQLQSSEAEKA